MKTPRLVLGLGAVLATSSPVQAHVRLTVPTARYPEDSLKQAPCGVAGGTRGTTVTTLQAGSVLHVEWEETVDHTSHYRISFDPDGDDDFADPPTEQAFYSNPSVLLDDLADPGGHMSADVMLPDVVCERCTLQLIQVMYGAGIYYQCADLRLVEDCAEERCDSGTVAIPTDGGTGTNPAGAVADPGTDENGNAPAPSADTESPTGAANTTSCSVQRRTRNPDIATMALLLLGLATGRRRRLLARLARTR